MSANPSGQGDQRVRNLESRLDQLESEMSDLRTHVDETEMKLKMKLKEKIQHLQHGIAWAVMMSMHYIWKINNGVLTDDTVEKTIGDPKFKKAFEALMKEAKSIAKKAEAGAGASFKEEDEDEEEEEDEDDEEEDEEEDEDDEEE